MLVKYKIGVVRAENEWVKSFDQIVADFGRYLTILAYFRNRCTRYHADILSCEA